MQYFLLNLLEKWDQNARVIIAGSHISYLHLNKVIDLIGELDWCSQEVKFATVYVSQCKINDKLA